jgi:hypothetical protein
MPGTGHVLYICIITSTLECAGICAERRVFGVNVIDQALVSRVAESRVTALPPWHAALLCHSCVLLLEAVAQPLRALHMLVDASHNATLFARGERLALEAVDAVVEAVLDEIRVHLCGVSLNPARPRQQRAYVHKFLHLLLLHARLQFALLRGRESVGD